MLKITNQSEDKDFIVNARQMATGTDGQPTTVGPGESATIEIDGDHQVFVATRARESGEPAIPLVPVATVESANDPVREQQRVEPVLSDADDDTVRAEIEDMVNTKSDLTQAGLPNLDALNARLEAKGFNPVNADRRGALMPQPA